MISLAAISSRPASKVQRVALYKFLMGKRCHTKALLRSLTTEEASLVLGCLCAAAGRSAGAGDPAVQAPPAAPHSAPDFDETLPEL